MPSQLGNALQAPHDNPNPTDDTHGLYTRCDVECAADLILLEDPTSLWRLRLLETHALLLLPSPPYTPEAPTYTL